MKRKRKARSLCVCETLLTGSASLTEVVCVCDNNVCVCVCVCDNSVCVYVCDNSVCVCVTPMCVCVCVCVRVHVTPLPVRKCYFCERQQGVLFSWHP